MSKSATSAAPTPRDRCRVLIADDHPMVRAGLRSVLQAESALEVVDEAANGPETISKAGAADLVVLDLQMPGTDGVELIKQLRAVHSTLKILILTIHAESELAVRCFRAGASGYVNKACDPSVIISAILRVAAGRKYASEAILEHLLFELDGGDASSPHKALSDREYQVLCRLASGRTSTEIASELSLSVKTVSTYRRRIMDKMEMGSTVELMRYALREGLVQ